VRKLTTADTRPDHQLLPLLLKLQPPMPQAAFCHHNRAQLLIQRQTSDRYYSSDWYKQWYPVAIVEHELNPAVPTKVQLLGMDLVLVETKISSGGAKTINHVCSKQSHLPKQNQVKSKYVFMLDSGHTYQAWLLPVCTCMLTSGANCLRWFSVLHPTCTP